jgi:hypothetical protein
VCSVVALVDLRVPVLSLPTSMAAHTSIPLWPVALEIVELPVVALPWIAKLLLLERQAKVLPVVSPS